MFAILRVELCRLFGLTGYTLCSHLGETSASATEIWDGHFGTTVNMFHAHNFIGSPAYEMEREKPLCRLVVCARLLPRFREQLCSLEGEMRVQHVGLSARCENSVVGSREV